MKNVEDVYPLSSLQQGILFHSLSEGQEGVYGIQFACTLEGDLSREAFRQAWGELVARHAILRTAFLWQGLAAPLQVVRQRVELPWVEEDWRGVPAQERERRLAAVADEDRLRPFDLSRAPVLRLRLVRLAEREHRLLWSFHHLLLDGWSVRLLLRDLLALYVAARGGAAPQLAPHRPYGDYIAWLQGRGAAAAETFWRSYLRGFAAPTRLDLEPAVRWEAGEGSREALDRLPAPATAALRAFARQRRLTLNTAVLGAWAQLLGRYSGDSDVVFGIVVSGRPAELAGVESMVGLFINTLPLRVRLRPGQSAEAWLAELQAGQVELREHEHSSLAQVQGWSELPRGAALFDSVFAFENYPAGVTGHEDRGGLEVRGLASAESTHYAINLLIGPADELVLRVLYDARRFTPATVARLLGHLRILLEGLAAPPGIPTGDLPFLSAPERHQVLAGWNDTAVPYDCEALLHGLFETEVRRRPDAVAAVFGERELTYGELDRRANQLAHHLRALGVGPGDLVAIYLRRSLEMVPALLGVLKAGAAYVPLEPHFPRDRVRYILGRLDIRCVLLQSPARGGMEETCAGLPRLRHLVALDPLIPGDGGSLRWPLPELDRAPETALPARLGSEALAYIIFTSGSTGHPKGVVEGHRSVVNLIEWAQRAFALGPADRVLFITSLCFDLSVYDVFGLLAAGGSVRIASEEEVRDPERLAAILATEPVTFWDSAPAALQQIVPFLPEETPVDARLRLVFLSGDWIPVALPGRVRATFPGARVIALGGATEATVWSNVYPVGEVDPAWTSIPYGRPIQNASYHALDAGLHPLPVGVEGDLYIGGECLALGYAAEPALTADRFLPDPFSAVPGGRLYRTGDRARFLADGNLEFRGRRDHQVKIRGFRVELGEIEAVLLQHPSVREAVALAREDQPGNRVLVAYVVPRPGAAAPAAELRAHAATRLPDYMVPGAFVTLAEMPVTANGKLDRKALPAPDSAAGPGKAAAQAGPRTPIEEVTAGILSEVLRRDRVGVEDNFFELGGHSLLATQVVTRMRQALGVQLPLSAVFEAPTVAGLARRAESARRAGEGREVPPFPAGRTEPLPLSFAQQRLWFLDQLEPGSPEYNLFVALRISGPLDAGSLERALEEVVLRHESLRTTLHQEEGHPIQVVRPAGGFRLSLADLSDLGGEAPAELRRLAVEEAGRPFDLAAGPLLRGRLLRLGEDEHALLFTLHHIVSDAWSMGLLVREVLALYAASREGRLSPLTEPRFQYPDYACWQRSWLRGEVLEGLLAYWRQRLGGGPPPLDLPTDRPRGPVRSHSGGELTAALPRDRVGQLRALGREEDATLFMVLLAALKTLLHRRTGQLRIAIGTDAVNRGIPETEEMIGFFVNQLVLSTDLAGNPPFRELLRRVREGTLEAYDHQDLPFDLLVEALQPVRDLGRTPLFQIKLIHQTVPEGGEPLPGVTVAALDLRQEPARFDLAVFVTEEGPDLRMAWIYRDDLFERGTIERLAAEYSTLLASVADHPDLRLSALEIVPASERAAGRPRPSFRSIRPQTARVQEG